MVACFNDDLKCGMICIEGSFVVAPTQQHVNAQKRRYFQSCLEEDQTPHAVIIAFFRDALLSKTNVLTFHSHSLPSPHPSRPSNLQRDSSQVESTERRRPLTASQSYSSMVHRYTGCCSLSHPHSPPAKSDKYVRLIDVRSNALQVRDLEGFVGWLSYGCGEFELKTPGERLTIACLLD